MKFIQGSSGRETLSKDLSDFGTNFSFAPTVYDMNRDGYDDLILSGTRGTLAILSGKDLSTLAIEKLTLPSIGALALADINSDKRVEIITELTDGRIETFQVNCPCSRGEVVRQRSLCFEN